MTELDDPEARAEFIRQIAEALDVPPELLQSDEGPSWWGAWVQQDQAQVRRVLDQAVATAAPDVLHALGLDPERYTLALDWQPGPYELRAE